MFYIFTILSLHSPVCSLDFEHTFQVLSSHVWLVATTVDRKHLNTQSFSFENVSSKKKVFEFVFLFLQSLLPCNKFETKL